jgi:predicted Rossmann fold nucleotide-binding protein DprA/Smf involved in DNA uptake
MMQSLSEHTSITALLCLRMPEDGQLKPLSQREFRALCHIMESGGKLLSDIITLPEATLLALFHKNVDIARRVIALRRRSAAINELITSWLQRGIWILGDQDQFFPRRLKHRLATSCPPLLFGFGSCEGLDSGGLCIVGSRRSSPEALIFSEKLAERCADENITVISSDMRGVDRMAIQTVLANQGQVKMVLSDRLEKAIEHPRYESAIDNGRMTFITPFAPNVGFSIGNAIRANRYQYALSDITVVAETRRTGGVWKGAEENRKKKWVPAFVRHSDDIPPGNRALMHLGLQPVSFEDIADAENLQRFFLDHQDHGFKRQGEQNNFVEINNSSLFRLFMRQLKTFAVNIRTEAEIAEYFGLEQMQVQAWLRRGEAIGKVRKQKGRDTGWIFQK